MPLSQIYSPTEIYDPKTGRGDLTLMQIAEELHALLLKKPGIFSRMGGGERQI